MTLPVHYAEAAICRQGHVVSAATWYAEPTGFCPKCGDKVETNCQDCGIPIRGARFDVLPMSGRKRLIPGHYPRPGFCSSCGSPFPWAERRELISELVKVVNESDLSHDQKLQAREQLEKLVDADLSEEEQKERWSRVRDLAPRAIAASGRIIERLVGEAVRQALGL